MTNSIIMLCGRIGSGKTTFAKKLQKRINAVVLSCDDFVIAVNDNLSRRHEIQENITFQLLNLAKQIWLSGVSVVLDFGFWYKEQRVSIKREFEKDGVIVKLCYLRCDTDQTNIRIEKRNYKILNNHEKGYIIDMNLKLELDKKFEEPDEGEIDILIQDLEDFENNINFEKEQLVNEIINISDFIIEQKCTCDDVILHIRPLYIEKIYAMPNVFDKLVNTICREFTELNIKHIFAIESAILPCASVIAIKLNVSLSVIRKYDVFCHEESEPKIFLPNNYSAEHSILLDDALWTGKTLNYCFELFEHLKLELPQNLYFIFDFRNFMPKTNCLYEKYNGLIRRRKVFLNYKTIVDKAFKAKKISYDTYIKTIGLFDI